LGGSEIAEEIAVEISEVSPVLRDVTISVGEGRARRAYTEACRALAKRVRVKGFRQGRAPDEVLLKLYGPDLAQDAQRRLLEETLPEAFEKSGLVRCRSRQFPAIRRFTASPSATAPPWRCARPLRCPLWRACPPRTRCFR